MSELNQKEVNEQMYLFVKRWLDDLPFEESKKVPVMAIGYCLARLSKQDELLKEDCHNCKLECLLQKYDELKEKYDSLLKEQEETELCDRCGRRRLKSNRERR